MTAVDLWQWKSWVGWNPRFGPRASGDLGCVHLVREPVSHGGGRVGPNQWVQGEVSAHH
jgi:hypothetical protein